MLRYADYDIVFQEIPGEVTLAINLSNCPNRCKGCHSPYLMDDIGEFLTEESLSWLLAQFLCCRQSIAPVKVGWYSGKSELPADFNMSYFEYIKLGPYVEALGGLKSAKTNQRLYRIVNGKMEDITYRFLSNQLFV